MTNTAAALMSRVASLTPFGRIYTAATANRSLPFSARVLSALDVTADVSDDSIARIPAAGPLVVVANHPFGALDGLLLLDVLARVRDDVKVLGNQWLETLPDLANHLLPVDVFGGRAAVRRNARAIRGALHWLRQGGCVGIFPAGEVAHAVGAD
jgi:putative hemolysin